jgi:hypothetical protein
VDEVEVENVPTNQRASQLHVRNGKTESHFLTLFHC